MATTETTSKTRGRYYDAPTTIVEVPGVVHAVDGVRRDSFRGSMDALVAAGLLKPHQFPGQPGLPLTVVNYRPNGVVKQKGVGWCAVAGYMEVQRTPSGRFRIILNVTNQERQRREAEEVQRERAGEEAAQAVLRAIPTHQRPYLDQIVAERGITLNEIWFHDEAWLAETGTSKRNAEAVLRGLQVYREADIERQIHTGRLSDARALLSRIAATRA
jgi:hypothetical protein